MKIYRLTPAIASIALALAWPACAQIVVVDFTSVVGGVAGTSDLAANVGDTITGHIEVNLATLAADGAGLPTLAYHSYINREPGFTFSITSGSQTISYDSVHASQEGGFAPGIGLSKGPSFDMVTFVLREQGNPYHMVLSLVDEPNPLQLIPGVSFPQDVHPFGIGADVATFDYGTEDNTVLIHATLTQFSMSTVPESDAVCGVTAGLLVLGAGLRAIRRNHR